MCAAGTLQKFTLNIHVTLEFFMVVPDFFVKFVILWPIAARFVWLKLGAMRSIAYCIAFWCVYALSGYETKESSTHQSAKISKICL